METVSMTRLEGALRGIAACAARALLLAAAALAGCATGPAGTATLEGVVRGNQAVSYPASDQLQVARSGVATAATRGMALHDGDAITTGADSYAVLSYPGGARVYLYPNTRVRIGSLIADIGQVFVRVKGAFKVKTTFVTAGSEGTEFWVKVGPRDEVGVVVVDQAVSLSSNTGAWPSRPLRGGQHARMVRAGPPAIEAAEAAEMRRESDLTRSIDQLLLPSGYPLFEPRPPVETPRRPPRQPG